MRAHIKYLDYVVRHKWFVFVAGVRVGAPLWRLVIHDWSKFTRREWGAYVAKFYGERPDECAFWWRNKEIAYYRTTGALLDWDELAARELRFREHIEQMLKSSFDVAWLHHQKRNDHLWQYWVLVPDSDGPARALAMPYVCVCEMVADWMGAGRAITGRWEVAEWYAKNKEKIVLHPTTRTLVESLIADPSRKRRKERLAGNLMGDPVTSTLKKERR